MLARTCLRLRFSLVVSVVICASLFIGCGSQNGGLPSQVTVTLPDGSTSTATLGAGVIALANTSWQFFRIAENAQGAAFMTVSFGDEGNLEAFENNTIASEIFGSTILFDGQRHNTSQAGLQYSAATYGAETADSTGFTFEGRLKGFAAGLEAANATATAAAQFDPDDVNVVRGTFTFTSRVTLISMPEANQDDEFSFVGRRIQD